MRNIIDSRISILLPFGFLIIIIAFFPIFSNEVGFFQYKGSIEDIKSDTIFVNDTIVAMSIRINANNKYFSDTIVDTPSLFILIDNSDRMSHDFWGTDNPPNDKMGARYSIMRTFIDSMNSICPEAEIGIAIFGSYLYFDPNDRTFFVACSLQTRGAYLPLLTLNRSYPQFGDRKGFDIINELLDTAWYDDPENDPRVGTYVGLRYKPTDTVLREGNTNINAAFDAAKCAMIAAKYPRQSQYVILLSDGAADFGSNPNDFVSGIDIPTTFTILFIPNGTVHTMIDTMTRNIQCNAYSTSNDRSAYRVFLGTSADSLVDFLNNNVYTKIICNYRYRQLTQATINGNSYDMPPDPSFILPVLFPLIDKVTPFSFAFKYCWFQNESCYKDSTYAFNSWINIQPGTILDTSNLSIKKWERNVKLLYNGLQIFAVDTSMDSLEIRFEFDPGTACYNYTEPLVDICNTATASLDKETYILKRNSPTDTFAITLKRETTSTPMPGNGIFEHTGLNDSIILLFRNNENQRLPMDSLRRALPILNISSILQCHKSQKSISITIKTNRQQGTALFIEGINAKTNLSVFSLSGVRLYSGVIYKDTKSIPLRKGLSTTAYLIILKSDKIDIAKKLMAIY